MLHRRLAPQLASMVRGEDMALGQWMSHTGARLWLYLGAKSLDRWDPNPSGSVWPLSPNIRLLRTTVVGLMDRGYMPINRLLVRWTIRLLVRSTVHLIVRSTARSLLFDGTVNRMSKHLSNSRRTSMLSILLDILVTILLNIPSTILLNML